MMKKQLNKLGISILLLAVMMLSAFAAMAIGSAADSVTEHTLVVEIPENAAFGNVWITIGNASKEKLISNQEYKITTGVQYKLEADPTTGYIAEWYNKTTGVSSVPLQGTANADMNYKVSFVPKTYNIHYVEEGTYAFTGNPPRTHTYNQAVSIPNVERSGYEMAGWVWYNADPDKVQTEGHSFGPNFNATLGTSDAWLKPIWKGENYVVVRLDCVYKEGALFKTQEYLGYDIFSGEMGTKVNGMMGDLPSYTGYTLLDDAAIYDYLANSILVSNSESDTDEGFERVEALIDQIKENPNLSGYNVVLRYYLPNEYLINVDLNAGDDTVTYENGQTMPKVHIYNANTYIPTPVRVGYDFSHWLTTVSGQEQKPLYPGTPIVAKTVDGEIFLTAVWTPKQFPIEYVWNGKNETDDQLIGAQNETLLNQYSSYTYGTTSAIPFPVRKGYVFEGWIVTQDGNKVYENALKELPAELFKRAAQGLTLSAQWTPATYTVTLNGNGNGVDTDPTLNVKFDSALDTTGIQIPVRSQYSFLGYFTDPIAGEKYINADGSSACDVWTLAQNTVLYAHWEKLPEVEAPKFLINYLNETFCCEGGDIPVGKYTFSFGEIEMIVIVTENNITVDGNINASRNSISIPNDFIGQTVQVTVHGDGTTTSDHVCEISIAARPKAPSGVGGANDISSILAGYTDITVKMNTEIGDFVYEFAWGYNDQGEGLKWQDTPMFTDLKQGTIYYVYVRAKAAEGMYPHGEAFVSEKINTLYQSYVQDMKDKLDALKGEADGEMVAQVIKDAKVAMSLLEPSADFYDTLNQIYAEATEKVKFASLQDEKLNELQALLQEMKDSGAYNIDSLTSLESICVYAQEQIKDSANSDAVKALYDEAKANMYRISISYLFNGDMELTAHAGLPHSVLLSLIRIEDIGNLSISVSNAIKLGQVKVDGLNMSVEDALRELRAKDPVAAYTMQLMSGTLSYNEYTGTFTLSLLLPMELREIEGLRVVYYNDKTGEIRVLDTVLEGNCLVFTADSIGDFVIMGDPIIDLSNLLWALAAILFLQSVAIILLLIRRKKVSARYRSYAFMPILPLTIRVFPDYALTAIVIFGILILLFQIFLIYLLLSSELVIRRKRKKSINEESLFRDDGEPIYRDTAPKTSIFGEVPDSEEEEYGANESEPMLDSLTEETPNEEAPEYAEESEMPIDAVEELMENDPNAAYTNAFIDFDDEEEMEAAEEYAYDENGQAYIAEDEFESEDDESIENAAYYGVDTDSFIEPAANPNYSLPEEAYDEQEESEGYEDDLAMGDPAYSFEYDEEEDLATGDEYYDEPVPYDENEGRRN